MTSLRNNLIRFAASMAPDAYWRLPKSPDTLPINLLCSTLEYLNRVQYYVQNLAGIPSGLAGQQAKLTSSADDFKRGFLALSHMMDGSTQHDDNVDPDITILAEQLYELSRFHDDCETFLHQQSATNEIGLKNFKARFNQLVKQKKYEALLDLYPRFGERAAQDVRPYALPDGVLDIFRHHKSHALLAVFREEFHIAAACGSDITGWLGVPDTQSHLERKLELSREGLAHHKALKVMAQRTAYALSVALEIEPVPGRPSAQIIPFASLKQA